MGTKEFLGGLLIYLVIYPLLILAVFTACLAYIPGLHSEYDKLVLALNKNAKSQE